MVTKLNIPASEAESKLRAVMAFCDLATTISDIVKDPKSLQMISAAGKEAADAYALTDDARAARDKALSDISAAGVAVSEAEQKTAKLAQDIADFEAKKKSELDDIKALKDEAVKYAEKTHSDANKILSDLEDDKADFAEKKKESEQKNADDAEANAARALELDTREKEVSDRESAVADREEKNAVKESALKTWETSLTETQNKLSGFLDSVKTQG